MVVEGIAPSATMKCVRETNKTKMMMIDDMGDGMQCSEHPFRNNTAGICAFCLQDKLGKLVSSSFPLPLLRPNAPVGIHSSSRSSAAASPSITATANTTTADTRSDASRRKNDASFLFSIVMSRQTRKKKSKKSGAGVGGSSSSSSSAEQGGAAVFNRSKSTATPSRRGNDEYSPRVVGGKKGGGGFWSFLNLSSSSSTTTTTTSYSSVRNSKTASFSSVTSAGLASSSSTTTMVRKECVVLEENDVSFERKVSRSRSVGCGSRSFSGDFFERISTGFGDCTLRRVESQREGKPGKHHSHHHARDEHSMKERVRCGGIFGGFILTSSSSEWDVNGPKSGPGSLLHGRTRSWGWAFASPIRAFSRPNGPNSGKRNTIRQGSGKSTAATTPNLAAIPSLLAVRS